jgi:hypothetical protein
MKQIDATKARRPPPDSRFARASPMLEAIMDAGAKGPACSSQTIRHACDAR